jgi:hypothetical protein
MIYVPDLFDPVDGNVFFVNIDQEVVKDNKFGIEPIYKQLLLFFLSVLTDYSILFRVVSGKNVSYFCESSTTT